MTIQILKKVLHNFKLQSILFFQLMNDNELNVRFYFIIQNYGMLYI